MTSVLTYYSVDISDRSFAYTKADGWEDTISQGCRISIENKTIDINNHE